MPSASWVRTASSVIDPCLAHRLRMPASARLTPIVLGPTDGFANSFFSLTPGQGHFGPDAIPGGARAALATRPTPERRPPLTARSVRWADARWRRGDSVSLKARDPPPSRRTPPSP